MGIMDTLARNVSSQLVGKFGQRVRFKERQAGKFNVTTDNAKSMEIEHEASAILAEFNINELGGVVQSGDKKLLVAAKDLPRTPTPEWRVKIATRWYEIVAVTTSYSGDEGCVHKIVARGR